MSSVETLREAAKVLRERAEAATPGPWEADMHEVSQHWSRPEPWQTVASSEVACMAYCYGGSGRGIEREEDATFIATMHPGVALALADWLGKEADGDGRMSHRFPDLAEGEVIAWVCAACGTLINDAYGPTTTCPVDWRPRNPHALRVAEAILRGAR